MTKSPRLTSLARRIGEAKKLVQARGDPLALYADGVRQALGEMVLARPEASNRDALFVDALTRIWSVDAAEAQRRYYAWGEAGIALMGGASFFKGARAKLQEVDREAGDP